MPTSPTLISQVFPISRAALPHLRAYQVEVNDGGELHEIGGGLSYRAYRHDSLSGTWVWSQQSRRLLTDAGSLGEEPLQSLVESCWESGEKKYHALHGITPDPGFEMTAQAQADFVAGGLWHRVKKRVQDQLGYLEEKIDPVHIERRCRRRARVIEGRPALQLSVTSKMTHQDTLREHLDRNPDADLLGLAVEDRIGGMSGTIEEIVGKVSEHRQRLLSFSLSEEMVTVIEAAGEEVKVVGVEPFGGAEDQYDYVVDALDIVVQTEHYERLNVPTEVQNRLTLSPARRASAIRSAAYPLKDRGIIGDAFSSRSAPEVFGTGQAVGYEPRRKLADDSIHEGEEVPVRSMKGKGLVEKPPAVEEESSLRVAVLSAGVPLQKSSFGTQLQRKLGALQLPQMQVKSRTVEPEASAVRNALSQINEDLAPHVLIAVLPNPGSGTGELYVALKQSGAQADLPSQVITEDTLGNRYAIDNIALGIVGKMGGVPYVLGSPLSYADRVVGLDIARTEKKRTEGTMSVAASTHHFGSDGRLRYYATHQTSVEGETLPPDVLRRLFPREEYSGKRILVHRDGPFQGDEAETLEALGEEIGASFYLVEILKQGAPRLYEILDGNVEQISKGSYLRASDRDAFVASTPPPFDKSTAQPLQVQVRGGNLPVERAAHSVLAFTLMHYGSVRPPRLPVTIHYSDKIAKLLMKGIHPPAPAGTKPYWL